MENEIAHHCDRRVPTDSQSPAYQQMVGTRLCLAELQRVEDRWRCPQHGFLDKVLP
jgi:hypothetical protein